MAFSKTRSADIRLSSAGPVTIAVGNSSAPIRLRRRISAGERPSSRATTLSIRSRTKVSISHGPR